MNDWDASFLDLADFWARKRSKDPSTKVGAIVVRPDRTIASIGFNGFAPGLSDAPELYADRGFKIATVIHAEENAMLTAREPLHGYTIYVSTLPPCAHCASLIIRAGMTRVVSDCVEVPERWRENMRVSLSNLIKAGLAVDLYDRQTDTLFHVSLTEIGTFRGVAGDGSMRISF